MFILFRQDENNKEYRNIQPALYNKDNPQSFFI